MGLSTFPPRRSSATHFCIADQTGEIVHRGTKATGCRTGCLWISLGKGRVLVVGADCRLSRGQQSFAHTYRLVQKRAQRINLRLTLIAS